MACDCHGRAPPTLYNLLPTHAASFPPPIASNPSPNPKPIGGGAAQGEVKFLKPGKAVILLQGRYARKKAVIVPVFKEGTCDHPYGHCLVAGLAKYPKKVIRKDSAKTTAKKSRVKVFLKLLNFTHLMPTRYTLDIDLKEVVSGAPDSLTTKDKKLTAAKSAKAKLEERFKTGKNRWFFTKLRF
ncbi:60S ribosomal protein L27-2-like [Hordeum vulgare subsp. vulgare]|uniref:60S ribosomal protein L27-2-like n=1 Tax=Hordeum vulgare subsp. vulgare TaxID=112509 RepID=UPI001D1A3955|nr:60S ribosomal protein L27-2-like [Hordeum vulgare subsp. vulgare]